MHLLVGLEMWDATGHVDRLPSSVSLRLLSPRTRSYEKMCRGDLHSQEDFSFGRTRDTARVSFALLGQANRRGCGRSARSPLVSVFGKLRHDTREYSTGS